MRKKTKIEKWEKHRRGNCLKTYKMCNKYKMMLSKTKLKRPLFIHFVDKCRLTTPRSKLEKLHCHALLVDRCGITTSLGSNSTV